MVAQQWVVDALSGMVRRVVVLPLVGREGNAEAVIP